MPSSPFLTEQFDIIPSNVGPMDIIRFCKVRTGCRPCAPVLPRKSPILPPVDYGGVPVTADPATVMSRCYRY